MFHQNVQTAVPNPEAGCTYYEQYCIDDDRFQLGKLGGVVGRPMYVSCDGIVISAQVILCM